MKILINGRCLEGRRTGVGRYLANVLRIWSDEYSHHDFDIFFRNEISEDSFLSKSNVSSTLVPNSRIFDLGPVWENFYLPRALKKNQEADVYFSPLYTLPALPLNFKKVVTIFDISYIAHPEWFPKRQLASLRLLTGPTVKKADAILTGSEATKEEILKYYDVSDQKIHVTNLGVEEKFFDLEKEATETHIDKLKAKYKLSGKVILFIGLIMNRRNIPVVMEAVSEVINMTGETLTLVIIGKNHSYPYFDVVEEADKHGIKDHFRWVTYTTDEEVFSFYKAADVFICSSLYEGFNIPPLEAMSLGVPVICSNLSSLPEVVGDAAYLLEDPRDAKEMTAGITAVLTDKELQKKLVKKGKERASQFSWSRCAKETMEIIETL